MGEVRAWLAEHPRPELLTRDARLEDARRWLHRMRHGLEAHEDRDTLTLRLAGRWRCGVGEAGVVLREVMR